MHTLSLLLLALPLALANHASGPNHRELAKRARGDITLSKRYSGARWTFYSAGLGACGNYNTDSDFIVALNQDTFGTSYPSPYCGKKISMTYNGKTTTATVQDACPGCPGNGGLDLTPGLFSFFADQSEGVIYGTWSFEDGSSSSDDDQTTTKKTTTTTHHTTSTTSTTSTTEHTTTSTTHTTTSTTSTTKTTSSTTSSTSSTHTSSSAAPSSSSTTHSSAASNSLAAPSGTVSPTSTADPENLYTFAQAVIGLTGVVVAGANAE